MPHRAALPTESEIAEGFSFMPRVAFAANKGIDFAGV
jgi:hypothetical protein